MRRLLIAALAFAASISLANAQTFPNRPVKLICPFPAGGSADLVSRVVAKNMSEALGQPVVVENHPGAGGRIGVDLTAKAQPNGYTVGLGTVSTLGIAPVIYPNLPYDPQKSLAPIGTVIDAPVLAVVNAQVPAKTLQEFIALAKASPGKLNFASIGPGTQHHLSAEEFQLLTGTKMTHVAYTGAAPAVVALMANEVQSMFDILASFQLENFKAGKLRALAVAGPKRLPSLPEVPTTAEAGLPNFKASAWFALVAPAGTPDDVLTRLNAALRKAQSTKEVIDTVGTQGLDVTQSTRAELSQRITTEIARWRQVVTAIGFKLE
jgi:tripartite-type tricarboxylate transporter receptor subunit TctC